MVITENKYKEHQTKKGEKIVTIIAINRASFAK